MYNELNLDTIKYYFNEHKAVLDEYWEFAQNAGFKYCPENDEQRLNIYYSHIVNISKQLGICTIESLDETLERSKEFADEYIKLQFLGQEPDESGKRVWLADKTFIIYLVLMSLLNEKELANYKPKSWSEEILKRVKNTIIEWKGKKKKTTTANNGYK